MYRSSWASYKQQIFEKQILPQRLQIIKCLSVLLITDKAPKVAETAVYNIQYIYPMSS